MFGAIVQPDYILAFGVGTGIHIGLCVTTGTDWSGVRMIRKALAYCPCCLLRLSYHYDGNYFYHYCAGWLKLSWSDKRKEIEAAEKYDKRFNRKVYKHDQ